MREAETAHNQPHWWPFNQNQTVHVECAFKFVIQRKSES